MFCLGDLCFFSFWGKGALSILISSFLFLFLDAMFVKFGVGVQAYVRRFINSRQFIFEWLVLQDWKFDSG